MRNGAFTGALRGAGPLTNSTHGGTLFLDEVGEFQLETQVALDAYLRTRVRACRKQPSIYVEFAL